MYSQEKSQTHFRSLAGAVQHPVFALPVTLRTHHDFPSNVGVAHLFAAAFEAQDKVITVWRNG